MPSADFADAQERLAARRRQREVEAHELVAAQVPSHASRAVSRLPFPFSSLGSAGIAVWDGIKNREGTRPAFRVGQVDAELLDEELLELLKGQIGEALKYFGSHIQDDYSAEILLLLRAVLFKLTIWDHNASYGAALQGLRYTDARNKSFSRPPPKRWQKGIYGLVTVGGKYAWTKWEDWLVSQSDDYSGDTLPRQRLLQQLTTSLTTTHSLIALASFLIFLTNGRYRTLLDRVLQLRLTPTTHTSNREVSFEYLNRQLVWHAFTEFLLFLLPLVGISRWRRILSRFWRRVVAFFTRRPFAPDSHIPCQGELAFLPERTCAICHKDQHPAASESDLLTSTSGIMGSAQTDVTNPYEAIPCGCIYCYVCLVQRIEAEEGEGWTCLRCGETVMECRPWSGNILEEASRPTSRGKVARFAEANEALKETSSHGPETPEMKVVDPIPEEEDERATACSMIGCDDSTKVGKMTGLINSQVAVEGLDESAEWARTGGSSEEDEQSEEYDEEEEEIELDEVE